MPGPSETPPCLMMGTTRVRIVKQYPEDKLGLVYTVTSRHVIINQIRKGSVMAVEGLHPGQEITSITVGYGERIPVEGLDRESVKQILRSITSFAVFEARDPTTTYSQEPVSASVTKPEPNSKLGIVYTVTSRGTVIENIKNDGLLASTDLRPGYEIESINGTDLLGLNREEVTAIFRSITSEISIKAKIPVTSSAIFGISTRATCEMLCQRSVVPSVLKAAGVPESSWKVIYDAISTEMIPTTKRAVELDVTYQKEMGSYMFKQTFSSEIMESRREKRAYQMLHQASICNNTATIAATNVLTEANFLLNSHGIYAKLEVYREDLPKFSNTKQDDKNYLTYPCGMRFIRPEPGQCTPHVPLATASALPVVFSAPCYEMD